MVKRMDNLRFTISHSINATILNYKLRLLHRFGCYKYWC